jgi:hypothetical protein
MRLFAEQFPIFQIAERIEPANVRSRKLGPPGDYHLLYYFSLLDARRAIHDAPKTWRRAYIPGQCAVIE